MEIGYDRIKKRKETEEAILTSFSELDLLEVIIDPYRKEEVYPESSRLTHLIHRLEPGDTVVIHSLERVSESVITIRGFLKDLVRRSLQLKVLDFPSLTVTNWLEVLEWQQEQVTSPKNRIVSIEKETALDMKQIRPFAKDPSYRILYWSIFKEIQRGASLRRTAKRLNVSQGTVLRVKRNRRQFTQTGWLVATFFVTIISLNIAQAYSSNWLLQVVICALATILIVYLSYSDSKEVH